MPARWKVPLIVGLSVMGAFWLIAAPLFAASWRSDAKSVRVRNAQICAPTQVFSGAVCRITLPGTLTRITSDELEMAVGGRRVRSAVAIKGNLPDASRGIPVEVTLYRGEVIHVEGETGLSVDTNAAPSTMSADYRFFGFCFLAFGVAFGGFSMGKTAATRR